MLTKASIVEREVNDSKYYGQVARVIENRLAQVDGETQGKLQMDSTVLYGLGRSGGIPTPGGGDRSQQPVQHLRAPGASARPHRQPQ